MITKGTLMTTVNQVIKPLTELKFHPLVMALRQLSATRLSGRHASI